MQYLFIYKFIYLFFQDKDLKLVEENILTSNKYY